jgi:hypothetical protein
MMTNSPGRASFGSAGLRRARLADFLGDFDRAILY